MKMERKQRPTPSPDAIARARGLRRDATFPERLLWSRLRGRQLAGMKFRRQHAIGPFITDFYCDEARLVVEVDGMSHDRRAKADKQRSAFLRQEGFRIFRVTNDDVLEDVDVVLMGILRECGIDLETGERSKSVGPNSPHPGPLPEGEGELARLAAGGREWLARLAAGGRGGKPLSRRCRRARGRRGKPSPRPSPGARGRTVSPDSCHGMALPRRLDSLPRCRGCGDFPRRAVAVPDGSAGHGDQRAVVRADARGTD